MPTGYSRSPKLLKGAIIQFSAPLFVPVPNIIIFQYNPETMSRTLSAWAPPRDETTKDDPKVQDSLVQPYDPEESFNVNLELDAADDLENPLTHPITVATGIADRIAALEMLMYPPGADTLGGLLGGTLSLGSAGVGLTSGSSAVTAAQRQTVPLILFFFGPGRIVPVRIISFSVDEQAYSPVLYPLRAKVTVGLKVLDPAVLTDDGSAVFKIAKACYAFTRGQKQTLALARNAENAVDAIMALLPS